MKYGELVTSDYEGWVYDNEGRPLIYAIGANGPVKVMWDEDLLAAVLALPKVEEALESLAGDVLLLVTGNQPRNLTTAFNNAQAALLALRGEAVGT